MKAINLTSINSDVYIRQGEGRKFENGVIHRFVLRDVHSQQVVNSAAAVIPSLLRNNPQHRSFLKLKLRVRSRIEDLN